jgi:hypothetical protein
MATQITNINEEVFQSTVFIDANSGDIVDIQHDLRSKIMQDYPNRANIGL